MDAETMEMLGHIALVTGPILFLVGLPLAMADTARREARKR